MIQTFCSSFANRQKKKILVILFLIAFLIHLSSVLFVYYENFQPFSNGGGDYVDYQRKAEEISIRVSQGNFSLEGLNLEHIYPVVVGYIYALTTPNMLIGQIFNALLCAVIVILVYLIVLEMGGSEKGGFFAGLAASVYPSLLFYGSLLLKDAIVVLLSLLAFFYILKIIKRFYLWEFLVFYLVLGGLMHFRFYIGYVAILSFLISWSLFSNLDFKKRMLCLVIMAFFIGFLPQIFTSQGYFGIGTLKTFLAPETITYFREEADVQQIQVSQPQPETQPQPLAEHNLDVVQLSGTDSSIVVKTGFENPFRFLINSSWSFICSLLGPFPWQLTHKKHFFMLIETIPWYFLFFFIVKGIIKSIKKKYWIIFPPVIFSILLIGVLSLYMTNFGVITRIRMPAFLALLCLAPFGLGKINNTKIPFLEKYFI